jgi:hypothetical protein
LPAPKNTFFIFYPVKILHRSILFALHLRLFLIANFVTKVERESELLHHHRIDRQGNTAFGCTHKAMHLQMWPNPVRASVALENRGLLTKLTVDSTKNVTVAEQSIDDFKCRLRIRTVNDVNVMKQNASTRLKPRCVFDMLIIT